MIPQLNKWIVEKPNNWAIHYSGLLGTDLECSAILLKYFYFFNKYFINPPFSV